MCEKYELALLSLYEYIRDRLQGTFKLKDLEDYVLEKAGTLRIAPRVTVNDWVETKVSYGIIKEIGIGEYKL